ncbi:MAG: segregation/condensation protein A [Pseudomonadota bacterium]|nr:segregation/condensation protein A [Pseudomonadota bacterium]
MRIGRAEPRARAADAEFEVDRAVNEPAFTVDVEGFEGPLDLLLELARRQKVDLARISILELADQYLAFVEAARRHRLELAADYLVMAAWLAYLKSRLLLPSPPKEAAEDAGDLAERLAARLRRLEVIRRAADLLMERPQLGRDVFARGNPESIDLPAAANYSATLYDLIAAYARQSQKRARTFVRMKPREVWTLAQARDALGRLIGDAADWVSLDHWLLEYGVDAKLRRSARASSFSASLELVREGQIELRQDGHFAPLYLRKLDADAGRRNLALVEG